MIHVAHLFYTMNTFGQPTTPALIARFGKLFFNVLFPGAPGEQPGVLQMGDLEYLGFKVNSLAVTVPAAFTLQADVKLTTKATDPAVPTAWSAITPYVVDDWVSYLGLDYVCIANNLNQVPNTSPTFWQEAIPCPPNAVGCLPSGETNFPTYTSVEYALSELYTASLSLGMPGVAVASGPSVTPVPAPWSAVTTYATGDEVSYLGPNYLALQASTNRVPDASPLFWQIAAPFPT
jgi:hypothetical protein